MQVRATADALRRTVLIVAVLNLGYFGIESWAALACGSVGLGAVWRARVGMALARLMAVPALAFRVMLVQRRHEYVPPAAMALNLVGRAIGWMNLDAARDVCTAARTEGRDPAA